MCGITGFIDFSHSLGKSSLLSMLEVLHHRGPDDEGNSFVRTDEVSIGLGHKRLSILDLSKHGHQPMKDSLSKVSIVYNGEVYNFTDIRKELESLGVSFDSQSDTEVILKAYIQWGMACVHRFVGMFAFAILDESKHELILCRDRSGVKPLFYSNDGDCFLFGSELKALMQVPSFKKEIDLPALSLFFKYSFIPAPYTVFKNCYKIEPGHFLTVNLKTRQTQYEKYWDVFDCYNKPKLELSFEEAKSILHDKLREACDLRMVSDVPVGIFLSSGYDSSLVAALLQKNAMKKLKTFTIGFDSVYDESSDAQKIADYLGTDHHHMMCTEKEALSIIPELPEIYDEPFGDSSAIPTILVSRFAKQHVKVALSADGGDEIFCGYLNRYTKYLTLFKRLYVLNKRAPFLTKLGLVGLKAIFGEDSRTFSKLNSLFQCQSLNDLYQFKLEPKVFSSDELASLFGQENISSYETYYHHFHRLNESSDVINKLLAVDYKIGLTDDILQKVDRAAMSTSLEGREPLMDHRILEFAAQLPSHYKLHNNTSKYILKDIVHDYIPKDLMSRPKKGFGVPLDAWLSGPLSDLAHHYLGVQHLRKFPFLDIRFVTETHDRFKKNPNNLTATKVWYLLMTSMWLEKWMK
ncbi:asparagine synthase (glutamine-hydrolyzing) [Candidatus Marinamargulisbacteria bacterium SCGC AG-439-L15]|nr:asparagine synthase (glutamine-hydrolyzing) [Candidatus Marinamargulisbacteria bacterium SCGC AG-439-L15]